MSRFTTRKVLAMAAAGVLALGLVSCADEDDDGASGSTTTEAGATTSVPTREEGIPVEGAPDTNGDGVVRIGLLIGGDANDGGFYQSVRQYATDFTDTEDWELVVVDNVAPSDYVQEMTNLARQAPDMMVTLGGVSPYEALIEVSDQDEFSDIAFVMLAGTAEEVPTDNFITVGDDVFEINYISGVASALVMERDGETKAGFVSGPELDFTMAARAAFEAGVKSRIPDAEVVATFTGDMDASPLAVEAVRAQINNGAGLIYPYLGGAAEAVVGEANSSDVPVFSVSVDRCDDPSLDFAGASLFSKAPYLIPILEDFRDGDYFTGHARRFAVGVDEGPGTVLCDPSDEEQEILDGVAEEIGGGDIDPQELAGEFM